MSDSRVGKGARRRKTPSKARQSRSASDRGVTQNRELTDDERLDEFRKSFFQSVLPDLPTIPGYHVCWLTTTNPRDSIAARMRLGYEPVKQEDVPGWEHVSLKSGDYEGCIGVNEMIAFKLRMDLYESYMYEAHHAQPLAEETKLVTAIDHIREEVAAAAKSGERGVRIDVEQGTAALGADPDPGSFAETLGERD